MLKKIHLNNSNGIELENKIESGDFQPAKLQSSIVDELEQKAIKILAAEKSSTAGKLTKK
jgi:hypothetical protein